MKILTFAIAFLVSSMTACAQFGGMPSIHFTPPATTFHPTTPMPYFPYGGGGASSRAKVTKGDPNVLQAKKILVSIVTDTMRVEEYGSEKNLIDSMQSYYEKKKPGRGQKWRAEWDSSMTEKFKQLFMTRFNDYGTESNTSVQTDTTGVAYHLYITITYLNPGNKTMANKEPASINTICDFRDMNGQSVVIVTVDDVFSRSFGKGSFPDIARIGQCYQELGRDLYEAISHKFKVVDRNHY